MDKSGSSLREYSVPFEKVYEKNECVKCLDGFDKKLDTLMIRISIEDHDMITEELYIWDIPSTQASAFEFDSLKLYRWNHDSKMTDFYEMNLGNPLKIFDVEDLESLSCI